MARRKRKNNQQQVPTAPGAGGTAFVGDPTRATLPGGALVDVPRSLTRAEILKNISRASLSCSARQQLAILELDASASMLSEDKATEAEAAARSCIAELATPSMGVAFDVAVVNFAESARTVVAPRPASQAPTGTLLEPGSCGVATNFEAALLEAERLTQAATGAMPVVLLMTDGHHNCGGDPTPVARRLHAHALVVCVAFGSSADEERLARIASRPDLVTRARTGAELRALFAVVGRSMSLAGGDGTRLLTTLGATLGSLRKVTR